MTARKTQPKEWMESVGNAELFCRRQGSGPGILLIHGVACDCDYFSGAAEILAEHYTVISYDRRGYSRSRVQNAPRGTREEEQYSLRVQAEDAAAVIRASGLTEAFVVGCSAGGVVAAELAVLHPELVSGLFLHEPALRGAERVRDRLEILTEKLHAARENNRMIRALRAFIDAMGAVDRRAPGRPLQSQARDVENLRIFVRYEMESFFEADLSLLEQVRLPVWIGAGEHDRDGVFHQAAEEIAERLKLPLIFVPGCHNFPSDLPREFAVTVSGVITLMSADERRSVDKMREI